MVYVRMFFFFILTSLFICFSYSQIQRPAVITMPRLKVDNWQMDEGLPVNSIITVAQTADGWMFFGTEEGLVRFDGSTFSLLDKSNIPGLNVNFISRLLGGRDTSLWIGTEGDGLIRFKNNSYVKYNKANGLSDNRIYDLCEDSSGGIWIGTSGGGLNYLKKGKVSRYDTTNGLACNYIRSVAMDAKGRLWAGTQKGLSVIDKGKIKNYSSKDGLSCDFIEALAFDKEQSLWIGTKSGGLNVLRQDKFSDYTMKDGLTNNAVTSLCFDQHGMLWIGTNGGGITRMMNRQFYPFTMKDGLSSELIVALFEDREGNIWAGSSGAGIDRIKKKSIQTMTMRDGLPGDVILPVFEDHAGVLWLGIAGKGLNRLENGHLRSFTLKDGLSDYLVLSISEDKEHTLWVGTSGGGLSCYKNKKFNTYTTKNGLSDNVVTAVCCDSSGVIWAGTIGGAINRFENGRFSALTTKDGLSNDNVNCILPDRKGDLWVGTNGGLNRISKNKITVFNQKDGLSNDYILSLYEDREGNLWVGTASNGFNLMRGGKITQFTVKDGLINEVVLKILEDDFGYFWISCNKGIYKIKKQDLLDFADLKIKSLSPVVYGKSDGMETIECNGGVSPSGFKTHDGKLLFPTMKGVSVVDPNVMKTASSDFFPVFIKEFLVDGQLVKMTSPLSILSYSNRLEFRYAALNYSNPGKIRYRCMLVGYDKDWIECGMLRNVYYTNIPGGDYSFQVMASNESGQWDTQSYAGLNFRLVPPFYRSSLFYVIVVIFFLLLFFFIVYYFMARFQRNRLKLLVEERTRELYKKMIEAESSDRLKTAFMNNITHEIRTPLNGILGFSELMVNPDLTQSERIQYHAIVRSSSERLLSTVTDYMDISLLVSGNQEVTKIQFAPGDLLEEVYQKFLPSCQAKKLTLKLQIPSSADNVKINTDPELLFKVINHLADNAVKFTKQGHVSIGFALQGSELVIFVKDTGVGVNKELHDSIFNKFMQENVSDTRGHEGSGLGLSIVEGIAKLLKARIWIESEKGLGFSFFFALPFEGMG